MTVTQALNVMGLTRQATQQELRTAYRRLARRFHPDVSSDIYAHLKMQQLNNAKAVLAAALTDKPPCHTHTAQRCPYQVAHAAEKGHFVNTFC